MKSVLTNKVGFFQEKRNKTKQIYYRYIHAKHSDPMNSCSFTYVSIVNNLPCRATGVERTWEYLKDDFEREGEGLSSPTARYYETIGPGPQLFAVDLPHVYYHQQNKWWKYKSAYDIEFGVIDIPN